MNGGNSIIAVDYSEIKADNHYITISIDQRYNLPLLSNTFKKSKSNRNQHHQFSMTCVGNNLKYSDWAHNLKLRYRARDNSDLHTSQRWREEIELVMNQDWRRRGYWLRMKNNEKIQILTKDWEGINEEEI